MTLINLAIIYGIAGAINLIYISNAIEEFITEQKTNKFTKQGLFVILLFFYLFCILLWPLLFIAQFQDNYNVTKYK
jgi:hypothetical protein